MNRSSNIHMKCHSPKSLWSSISGSSHGTKVSGNRLIIGFGP